MIYNCGFFYLIILIFLYLMFVYRNVCDKYLIILVGIMISMSREMEDYEYLVVNLKRKGICNLIYGIDGEIFLEIGFEKVFLIYGIFLSDINIYF